jgi:hypothetical protein
MFCIVCTACFLKAQTIKQVEYFIDKDKGVGKNTKLNFTASADSSYQFNINVSGINTGFHTLYIRTKDSKGKWSFTYQRTIEVANVYPELDIINGEYFFDTDPGYGKGKKITVTPQDSLIVQDFNTVVSSLNNGYHKLYTRFKDEAGSWSLTNRHNIDIIKTMQAIDIIAAEYFFDADKGYHKATAKVFASGAPDSTFRFKISYNKIPANADTLFVRVEDSLGNWSITKFALFNVQAFAKNAIASAVKSDKNLLRVYPNPASDVLNIFYTGMKNKTHIKILNIKGQVVKDAYTSADKINIHELIAGTYILQLNDGESTVSTKFIKQ